MATLNPSSIALNQTNITGKRNPVLTLNGIRIRYKIDKKTQQLTEELDGYTVDILARNGIQSVKLPSEAVSEATYSTITEALAAEKVVKVNFGATASTLRGKFYALISKTTNQLVQGISCTATELNLVSIEEPEDEFDDDLNDLIVE